MHHFPFHIGDYAAATKHLSWDEDLAYRRLLDWYYVNERPLPVDLVRVCRLVIADTDERKAAVTAVLYEFFEETPQGWRHVRCDEEIERMREKQDVAQTTETGRQTRLQKHRKWRAETFQALRALGIVPDGLIKAAELRALAARHGIVSVSHETRDETLSGADFPNDATAHETPRNGESNVFATDLPTPTPTPTPVVKDKDKLSLVCAQPAAEHADGGEADLLGHQVNGHRGPPECPHIEVLGLWAEVMPDQVQHDRERWKGKRADHLRARWRETAVAKGWATQAEGLAYLRKFFTWCRRSPFLMGKVPPRPGHRQFELELAWLVNPENWTKAHEGKYHPEG